MAQPQSPTQSTSSRSSSWTSSSSSSDPRRQSTVSIDTTSNNPYTMSRHTSPSTTSPKVQLIPHLYTLSYDYGLSQAERDILDNTSFDALDLSSKDFDFDEIFTDDRPVRKLPSVVSISPERSNFSFSHYTNTQATRQKASRTRIGLGEMYVKNKSDARKR